MDSIKQGFQAYLHCIRQFDQRNDFYVFCSIFNTADFSTIDSTFNLKVQLRKTFGFTNFSNSFSDPFKHLLMPSFHEEKVRGMRKY